MDNFNLVLYFFARTMTTLKCLHYTYCTGLDVNPGSNLVLIIQYRWGYDASYVYESRILKALLPEFDKRQVALVIPSSWTQASSYQMSSDLALWFCRITWKQEALSLS
jgi:hypothetical protein